MEAARLGRHDDCGAGGSGKGENKGLLSGSGGPKLRPSASLVCCASNRSTSRFTGMKETRTGRRRRASIPALCSFQCTAARTREAVKGRLTAGTVHRVRVRRRWRFRCSLIQNCDRLGSGDLYGLQNLKF